MMIRQKSFSSLFQNSRDIVDLTVSYSKTFTTARKTFLLGGNLGGGRGGKEEGSVM